jgi:hypothetical protein
LVSVAEILKLVITSHIFFVIDRKRKNGIIYCCDPYDRVEYTPPPKTVKNAVSVDVFEK